MLGKHPRDDGAPERGDSVQECFKRQRIEETTESARITATTTFEDIPREVLAKIVNLLSFSEVLQFRSCSKQCLNATKIHGVRKVKFNMNDAPEAVIAQSKLYAFLHAGLLTEHTNVWIETKVRSSTTEPSAHRKTLARCFANQLLALDHHCASLMIIVSFDQNYGGLLFFSDLYDGLPQTWRPSYNVGLENYKLGAMEHCGEFALRLGCTTLGIYGHEFTDTTDLAPFVNCRVIRLRDCLGVDHTRLSKMILSCNAIFLQRCKSNRSARISEREIRCLGGCKVISLTEATVTDAALDVLHACTDLLLADCSGYSTSALRRLVQRGVTVIIDGEYWPPPPRALTPDGLFWMTAYNT